MIELNLIAENEDIQRIKNYLEENASKMLAEKIKNGVEIIKDGKTLINKKTLNGFMDYASKEAQKLAEKGKQYAMIHHETVFGWAIHYFEEDGIEECLYNLDGTEYKPIVKKEYKPPIKPANTVLKKNNDQFSMFDLMDNEPPKIEENLVSEDAGYIPDEDEMREALDAVHEDSPKLGSPIYQKYMEIQSQYPDYVIAVRLGDFYEVFGESAVLIANKLNLTLVSRDIGLEERIPMIGFPYHSADIYFDKIINFSVVVIVDGNDISVKEKEIKQPCIDLETGEMTGTFDICSFDSMAVSAIQSILGGDMIII